MNDEKYTPPKSESNIDEDDAWYFNNGASNHMTVREVLLIKVPLGENRLYKTQLKVGKEDTNALGRESGAFTILCNDLEENVTNQVIDEEADPHSRVTVHILVHETSPESEEDKSGSFLQCVHEKAIYKKVPNGEFIIVAINVDDLFVTGTSLDLINEFKRRMASQFEMSNLGELTYYLGIEVSQGKDFVEIKQERYARKILKQVGMEDCNATLYPMEPGLKLSKADDEPEAKATQYRKMVGCLHYLLHTRPDLAYLVGVVQLRLESNTSEKQTTVTLSSCETEFMVATAAACQAIWIRELLAKVTGLERQKRESKSRPVNEGIGAHKVQGDEIVTWCARVTLFDSEIQGMIVGEFLNQIGYGYEAWSKCYQEKIY
nr:hypothetical protein [Tanacetum cinerariifolium]GEW83540.1 hypothetical protein [Tanacetum cinerariifolium]GEW83542.1 hypothetical protein [Tanacetum cinerariifolium]